MQRPGVVIFYFDDDFRIQPFAVRTRENNDAVDMNAFLQSCIRHRVGKLAVVPEILAVRLPPFVEESDGNRLWLGVVYDAVWKDSLFDFTEGCTPTCPQRRTAQYRLQAYVEYIGDETVTPSPVLGGASGNNQVGHFVAHFTEAGQWYKADDSVVTGPRDASPKAFPYICFFFKAARGC